MGQDMGAVLEALGPPQISGFEKRRDEPAGCRNDTLPGNPINTCLMWEVKACWNTEPDNLLLPDFETVYGERKRIFPPKAYMLTPLCYGPVYLLYGRL